MTWFGTDEIDELTKRVESHLEALETTIEKLRQQRELEVSTLKLLKNI